MLLQHRLIIKDCNNMFTIGTGMPTTGNIVVISIQDSLLSNNHEQYC